MQHRLTQRGGTRTVGPRVRVDRLERVVHAREFLRRSPGVRVNAANAFAIGDPDLLFAGARSDAQGFVRAFEDGVRAGRVSGRCEAVVAEPVAPPRLCRGVVGGVVV